VQQVHAAKRQLKNIMQQHLHIIQDYCNCLLVPNVPCIKVTGSDEQQKLNQKNE
jgi:ribonuclease P protein component